MTKLIGMVFGLVLLCLMLYWVIMLIAEIAKMLVLPALVVLVLFIIAKLLRHK